MGQENSRYSVWRGGACAPLTRRSYLATRFFFHFLGSVFLSFSFFLSCRDGKAMPYLPASLPFGVVMIAHFGLQHIARGHTAVLVR